MQRNATGLLVLKFLLIFFNMVKSRVPTLLKSKHLAPLVNLSWLQWCLVVVISFITSFI